MSNCTWASVGWGQFLAAGGGEREMGECQQLGPGPSNRLLSRTTLNIQSDRSIKSPGSATAPGRRSIDARSRGVRSMDGCQFTIRAGREACPPPPLQEPPHRSSERARGTGPSTHHPNTHARRGGPRPHQSKTTAPKRSIDRPTDRLAQFISTIPNPKHRLPFWALALSGPSGAEAVASLSSRQ